MLLGATAVTAGALAAPLAASPAHAASDYTLSYVGLCYHASAVGCDIGNVALTVTSTYSYNQIWINGKVYCTHGGGWVITWCSNTNNGKSYLNVGMNWTGSITSGFNGDETSWWRMNILANGPAAARGTPTPARRRRSTTDARKHTRVLLPKRRKQANIYSGPATYGRGDTLCSSVPGMASPAQRQVPSARRDIVPG